MERMQTPGQSFYSNPYSGTFTREDVLKGEVIKINPALITVSDGFVDKVTSAELQKQVLEQVSQLLAHKIRTFHVDVNYEDYSDFGASNPDLNRAIFSPRYLQTLNHFVQAKGAHLNLHLLTDFPQLHIVEYENVGAGAVCFQLDSIPDSHVLGELITSIHRMGACASPVIETVGSENLKPREKEAVLALLEPVLAQVGMLTFQAAGTASRSDRQAGRFAFEQASSYVAFMKRAFRGTVQLQGGITTETIGEAVRLGTEFIVCGSEIFRNRDGRSPVVVIDRLLQRAAEVFEEQADWQLG
jgi:pentose-5-phosphate-3-epimerase